MEKITLIGRLGRDASVKESQQGTRFLTFTMACDAYRGGESRTHWYDVTSFDPNRYKNMLKYLTKGSSVTVVGDLDADIEEGRDGVTRIRRRVSADSIQFTPSSTSGQTSESKTTTSKKNGGEPDDIDESEITTKRSRKTREEPDEYEEEERPAKRSRRAEPEDDDEPEVKPKRKPRDEEDDEPEEKPKPKRKPRVEEDDDDDEPKARAPKPAKDEDEDGDDLPF